MVGFHLLNVPVLHISFQFTIRADAMLPLVGTSFLSRGKGANIQSPLIAGQYTLIRFTNKSFAI